MTTYRKRLVPLIALGSLLAACRGQAEDPDRARCQQQLESFYQLSKAPDFLETGYHSRALDALIALAGQVRDSRDPYCGLVRSKAAEIEQQRAASALSTAEVQAAIAHMRTVEHPLPEIVDSPAAETMDSGTSDATPQRPAAAPARQQVARPPAPPAPVVRPPPSPRTTYCQYTKFVSGRLTRHWTCVSKSPSEAQAACEEMLRQQGVTSPSCYCTDDPAYSGGKCK